MVNVSFAKLTEPPIDDFSDQAKDGSPVQEKRKTLRSSLRKNKQLSDENQLNSIEAKRTLSFSLPFSRKSKKALAEAEDVHVDEVEDDPVMALFKARATQRVRFSLENDSKYQQVEADEPTKVSNAANAASLKHFMKGAIFGRKSDFDKEVQQEIDAAKKEMVWESAESAAGAEVVRTRSAAGPGRSEALAVSFAEDNESRASVIKLLNKASRAQVVHFRYEYAVKCCVKALELLTKANYPDDHPTVIKTLQTLNNAHHALSSYRNSANIVKMGIRYEDQGDLVRALKMYTIAYRIRRDNLSPHHPSLVVLLNMLGSIQVKRDELEEAMEIYELALKNDPIMSDGEDSASNDEIRPPQSNHMARSVAYREMGTIYERWGEVDEALKMYNRSLDCIADYKGISRQGVAARSPVKVLTASPSSPTSVAEKHDSILLDLENVQSTRSFTKRMGMLKARRNEDDQGEDGGMELFLSSKEKGRKKPFLVSSSNYDIFFPPSADDARNSKKKKNNDEKVNYHDVDVALTLHQIGQLHRSQGEYNLALAAYTVALRGMKRALDKDHPNVAAILGNIGNLQKEMGDNDAAFETYQQVLAIESYKLGLGHPDVIVTLHNIATIDAARGNQDHALVLYKQVMDLQRKLFGDDHMCLAVTLACMGDVYERIGELEKAVECFEDALRIKTNGLGRHSLEVARLLHKLGKLAAVGGDYHLADSYLSRTVLIYRLNKLPEDDAWLIDANRDAADIDAAISMGRASDLFEF